MHIWEGYNSNKNTVSFDTQDSLDDKLHTLNSMMSQLAAQDYVL